MDSLKHTSLGQELFSSISHGIGALLSITACVFLIRDAILDHNGWKLLGFSIFSSILILVYLFSTLYHSLMFTRARTVFRILDQSSIFLLIAGTYTPFILIQFRTGLGILLFILVWVLAIMGILFKIFFHSQFKKLSLVFYLGLGWLILPLFPLAIAHLSSLSLWLVASGGFIYSLGTIFYAWEELPYNHGIWHLFVLAGSLVHVVTLFTL